MDLNLPDSRLVDPMSSDSQSKQNDDPMNNAIQQPPIGEMIRLSVRATGSLYSFASNKVCPVFRTDTEQTHFSGAVMTTYNRMTMWMHDLSIVVEPIHVQLAGVSYRSVFEHLLDLKWLIMHPETAEAFSAFTFVRRFDTADRIKDELAKNPGFDQSPFLAQLKLANDAFSRKVRDDQCQKHGWKKKPKHWWMESAEQRARALGDKNVFGDVFNDQQLGASRRDCLGGNLRKGNREHVHQLAPICSG